MHYSIHVFPGIRGPCFTGPESILLNRLLVSVELLGALLVRTVTPFLVAHFLPPCINGLSIDDMGGKGRNKTKKTRVIRPPAAGQPCCDLNSNRIDPHPTNT